MKITTRGAVFVLSMAVGIYLVVVAVFAYKDDPRSVGYVLFYQLPLVVFMLIPLLFFVSQKSALQKENEKHVVKNSDRVSLFLIYPLASAIIVTILVLLAIYFWTVFSSGDTGDAAMAFGMIIFVVGFWSFVITYTVVCIVNMIRCRIGHFSLNPILANVYRWFLLIFFVGCIIYGLTSFV